MAAVTIPVVQKAQPDKLESMRRKSFYILESTVNQLLEDDTLYREKRDGSSPGFSNTEAINLEGRVYAGKTKFCELYANALTKRVNTSTNCTPNAKTFTSADNVDWYLPVTEFKEGYAAIKFDVNGKAEPNCEYSQTCKHPDTFTYYLLTNGKLTETDPKLKPVTYCIRTETSGEGTVMPSKEYCGLTNGTYILTSVPKTGWISNWSNNTKRVKIKDKDETATVTFSELPKACIKLKVNCESGSPSGCGSYLLTNGNFTTDGNRLEACNLAANVYTITVTPKSNYSASWRTQEVILNGVDQSYEVDITENKYCAKLAVSCPDGGANVCGSYTVSGGGSTYGMDTSGNEARTCSLRNGNYTLNVRPTKAYKADTATTSFSIADRDWSGNMAFKKTIKNCKDDGYFEANGKKWSCPGLMYSYMTTEECEKSKNLYGIKNCIPDHDYWGQVVGMCGGIKYMPTTDDLASIEGLESALGLPEQRFTIWSGEQIDDNMASDYTYRVSPGSGIYYRNSWGSMGICLIE